MRRAQSLWLLIGLVLLLSAAMSRPPILGQATCGIELGDGTPPLEIAFNETPAHCGFLQFSWRAFLAMNWPPLPVNAANAAQKARGLADPAKKIGQGKDHETVWEQYQPNWYLFWPNNPPPAAQNGESFVAWNRQADLPAACGPKNDTLPANRKATKILSSLSKMDPMPGVVQAIGGPLLDQEGRYARYEIRFSYETFNYINKNQFYLKAAQTPSTTFAFPTQEGNAPGAIFVKAAWKVLTAEEEASGRFHKTTAWMFTPQAVAADVNINATCVGPVPVGLVGFHIVQKTAGFPLQIWATFEQVDNGPFDPSQPGTQRWSFFNAQSTKTPNQVPACPHGSGVNCDWQPTSTHRTDATGGPTQAVRQNPVPASPNNAEQALNQVNTAAVQALRQVNPDSVWQFYRLVEAQWQTSFAPNPITFFPPSRVANLTMETYVQGSSCMTCHRGARAANLQPADMSFELRLAWEPTVLPPPVH